MLIFNDFIYLKQSICAYTIALKKHHISPTVGKKYYPRDTSFIFSERHRESCGTTLDRTTDLVTTLARKCYL